MILLLLFVYTAFNHCHITNKNQFVKQSLNSLTYTYIQTHIPNTYIFARFYALNDPKKSIVKKKGEKGGLIL